MSSCTRNSRKTHLVNYRGRIQIQRDVDKKAFIVGSIVIGVKNAGAVEDENVLLECVDRQLTMLRDPFLLLALPKDPPVLRLLQLMGRSEDLWVLPS